MGMRDVPIAESERFKTELTIRGANEMTILGKIVLLPLQRFSQNAH